MQDKRGNTELVDWVDPNIGTLPHLLAPCIPEVVLPHGMIGMAPHTAPATGDRYLAERIYGFAFGCLLRCYTDLPHGLCGDDDQRALSSWYVFSAMGLYTVCPGRPVYDIGSPIFPHVEMDVGGGRTFAIKADGASPRNKYIRSAQLNGATLRRPWFSHQQLTRGGELVLDMGERPNKEWGSRPEDAPPSFSTSHSATSAG